MDTAIPTFPPHTLVPGSADRPGDDPIFRLNAIAHARAAAGADVLNATLGALFTDDGELAVMRSVHEAMAAVPAPRAAGYAPVPPGVATATAWSPREEPSVRSRTTARR